VRLALFCAGFVTGWLAAIVLIWNDECGDAVHEVERMLRS